MGRTCRNFLASFSPVASRLPPELCVQFWWINCCTGGRISGQANWVQFYFHEIRQLPSTQCSSLLTRLLFPGWRITLCLLRAVPTGIAVLWTTGIFTQRFLLVLHLCLPLPKASVRLLEQCRKHVFLFLDSVVVCLGEGADCFLILEEFFSFFFESVLVFRLWVCQHKNWHLYSCTV